ncbi:MAG: ABC transporter substrate-binding protein [Clostridia bacterium]|nr:ABC transporter substrate-binding protein [Clostridia bacterium]
MKKILAAILTLALLLGSFALAESTRTFTDDAGRTVTLPQEITRIAVSGIGSQIAVFALAPDMLVGVTSEWDAGSKAYIAPQYHNLPAIGQLYGGKGNLNLETLLAAAPQIVIDVGEAKKGIAEDLDALSQQTGVPFVHLTMSLEAMDRTYERLGELLHREEQAKVLSDYCREVYDRTKAIGEAADKTRLLFITGETYTGVIAKDSYHSTIIDMLSDNLAVLDNPSSKGTGNETDLEQIMAWDPDMIIFSSVSTYEAAQTDPLWQAVRAVAQGNYALVPQMPYNFMGFPPGVQQFLGMTWMAKLLYPELAEYDLYEEVARHFDLFYHCELTQEMYGKLMEN